MASSHTLEWSNEQVLRLIEEYEGKPELWDNQNSNYRVQSVKCAAWAELAELFDCHPMDVKCKINSLLTSHRRERCIVSRGGSSRWFAYDALQFIADKFPIRDETEAEPERENDIEEHSTEEVAPIPVAEKQKKRRYNFRNRVTKQQTQPARKRQTESQQRDSCGLFGEYVAESLRQYDSRTAAIVKHAINNILYETDMKKYGSFNFPDLIEGLDLREEESEVMEEREDELVEDHEDANEEEETRQSVPRKSTQNPIRLLNESMS